MRRTAKAAIALAVAGISSPAFAAAPLVTENFTNNTNGYWDKLNNTTAPHNYQVGA